MARAKAVTAAAPSPVKGEADEAEKLKAIADAEAKADADAKAKAESEQKATDEAAKAIADAEAKADADAKAKAESEALMAEAEWSFPAIKKFPATLTVTNAQPCSLHVNGTDETLDAGETRKVTFTDRQFAKFVLNMAQIAELRGWKAGEGVIFEKDGQNG